jgi:hypothetical protein
LLEGLRLYFVSGENSHACAELFASTDVRFESSHQLGLTEQVSSRKFSQWQALLLRQPCVDDLVGVDLQTVSQSVIGGQCVSQA